MADLLVKAKGLREEGLTADIWTGGYNVPPTIVMGSMCNPYVSGMLSG